MLTWLDPMRRAETCIINYLCRAADGEAGPNSVLLAGSFVNQDGRSSSLTAPNGPAQQQVIRAALSAADILAQVQIMPLSWHITVAVLLESILR